MSDGLTIRLLGEAELEAGGRPLPLPPSKKTRALLGYLALTGRAHRRDKLCDLFWDVADDPRAALRWSLSKLRELVDVGGRTRLLADREQVRLDLSDVRVDVLEARRVLGQDQEQLPTPVLEQALALFRGELLEGLELADFHAYHVWCLAEREALRRLHTGVLSTLLSRAGAQPERALPLARQLVDLDPLDTSARSLFMELLHASGRAREAEVEARTNQRLLDARAEAEPAQPAGRESQVGLMRRPERPLIGRERELSALSRCIADAGPFRACLVEAEAGVGKTRLLEAAIDKLPLLARLSGVAHELTPGSPFGAWLSLLRTALAARADAPLQAMLDGLSSLADASAARVREQLFEGVAAFLERLAQSSRRSVLVLDDIHWLDPGSAELLLFVSQRCAALPLTLLLSARPGALADNPEVLRALRALRRQGCLLELRLAAFTVEETRALLSSLNSERDAQGVQRDSGGNPLFVVELARADAEEDEAPESASARAKERGAGAVPLSIKRLVRDRTSSLPAEVSDVLRWASVLGSSFEIGRLEGLVALDAESFVSALELLERHDYLRFDGNQGRFSHDIVRTSVYDALSSPRRQLMHNKVARQLSAQADPSGALAAELSYHAALGGDAALAIRACLTAGYRCVRLSANADAHALARRGLGLVASLVEPERTMLEIDLLQLSFLARRPASDEALDARLAQLAARALELGAVAQASVASYLRALLNWEDGYTADARRFSREMERISRMTAPRERVHALGGAACCLGRLERDLPEAEAYLLEAEQLAREAGVEVCNVALGRGMLQRYRGELAAAEASLRAARQLAQRDGDRYGELHVLEELFEVEWVRGDFAGAERVASEMQALGERSRPGSELPFASAAIHLARYAASSASHSPELEASLAQLEAADAKQRSAYLVARAAEIALSRGDAARAAAQAEQAIGLARQLELRSEAALALAVRAQVVDRAKQRELCASLLTELEVMTPGPLSARARERVEAALARLGAPVKEKSHGARHRRARVR